MIFECPPCPFAWWFVLLGTHPLPPAAAVGGHILEMPFLLFSADFLFFLSLPAPPALALTFCPCAQSLSPLILWDNHLLPITIRNNVLPGLCCVLIISLVFSLYSHYLPLALPLMSSDATQKQNYYFYYYSSYQQKKITSTFRPKPWGKVTILGMHLDISGNI